MPDLDQLLDSLVADVRAGTRAPGAPMAIKRAQRRRTAIAATFAVTLIAACSGLAAGTFGGNDQISPVDEPPLPSPTLSSPAPPESQDSPEASPNADKTFETAFRKMVAQVPDWSIQDTQPMFRGTPCAGDWSSAATGFGGGNFDVSTNGQAGQVWHEVMGFPSAAEASGALERLAMNLSSCQTLAWQVEPIAETDAELASSAHGLIWIQQRGKELSLLEAATTDGPPRLAVQVEIAELMRSYME